MEVWVVIYDNGEEYAEDREEWIEAIMSTEEKAENYKPKGEAFGYFNRIESYTIDEPSNWRK